MDISRYVKALIANQLTDKDRGFLNDLDKALNDIGTVGSLVRIEAMNRLKLIAGVSAFSVKTNRKLKFYKEFSRNAKMYDNSVR